MIKVKHVYLAALGYGLLLLVVFYPFFFLKKTFLPTDLFLMLYQPFAAQFSNFAPFNHFESDILKFHYYYQWGAKNFLYQPYWMPETFGGFPQYANTYTSHFSTLNWVMKLGPLEWSYPLKLILFLWIAAINMFIFVKSVGASTVSAFFSGMSFGLSSLFFTMLLRWWIPGAYCWFPLILLFSYRFIKERNLLSFTLASVFLSFSFLDGFFQSSASIVMALYIFWMALLISGNGLRYLRILKTSLLFSTLVILAVLLSAVMWFPHLEYFYLDLIKGESRAEGLYFGKVIRERLLSVPALFGAVLPQVLGSVQSLDLTKLVKSHLQDFTLFIGTMPLVFVLAFARVHSLNKELKYALIILGFVGLFIPIFTPLDRFVYFRFFAVYITAASAIFAFGLDYFLQNEVSRKTIQKVSRWLMALLAALFAVFVMVYFYRNLYVGKLEGLISTQLQSKIHESTIASTHPDWLLRRGVRFLDSWSLKNTDILLPWFVSFLGLGIVFFWSKKKISNQRFLVCLFFITFGQLMFFSHQWLVFNDLKKYPLYPQNEVTDFFSKNDPHHEYRVGIVHQQTADKKEIQLVPTYGNFFMGYSTLEGFDGLRPLTIYDLSTSEYNFKFIGQLNVKYIISNKKIQNAEKDLTLRQDGVLKIYENHHVKPRGVVLNSINGEEEKADVKILSQSNNTIQYQITTQNPGIFVTSETYYPGWNVTVNGKSEQISKFNKVMRSVKIPTGKSVIHYTFKPLSFEIGKYTSFICWCMMICIWVLCFLTKKSMKI